jgi:hypothetical protein
VDVSDCLEKGVSFIGSCVPGDRRGRKKITMVLVFELLYRYRLIYGRGEERLQIKDFDLLYLL